MAITKEVLDELIKGYKDPEDITGPNGLLKQLSKAVIERAMQAEMTEKLGYEKSDQSKKETENAAMARRPRHCGPIRDRLQSRFLEIALETSSRRLFRNISTISKVSTTRFSQCIHEG